MPVSVSNLIWAWWEPIESILVVYFYWGWLFAIVGIVLGIMGLKSVKNKLAIAGLVLSVAGLVPYIYYAIVIAFRIG